MKESKDATEDAQCQPIAAAVPTFRMNPIIAVTVESPGASARSNGDGVLG